MKIVAASTPIVSGIAGRYATALFNLANEEKAFDKIDEALNHFLELLTISEDFSRFVASPIFGADEQVNVLKAVLKQAKIEGIAANFLCFVASKRRLFLVRAMISGYKALLAHKQGIVSAEVITSAPLVDVNRAALLAALEAQIGKKVSLNEKVDPSIIGGLIVKIDSRMIDASLKTKLNAMKIAMING